MPQLDHFSFFSQVFWVLFSFTIFYFLNIRQILPAIGSILKVRRRVFQKSQDTFEKMQSNKTNNFVESHTEFFALTKTFATFSFLTSDLKTNFLLVSNPSSSTLVKNSFDVQLKNAAPKFIALKTFSYFVKKSF